MKKIILVLLFIIPTCLFSQEYKQGLGIRGGTLSGITYKHTLEGKAVEIILFNSAYRDQNSDFGVAGFFEWQKNIGISHLDYVLGLGAHIAFGEENFGIGGDAMAGVEYHISDFPLTIGLDIIPQLTLFTETDFDIHGSLSVRYVW